MKTVYLVASGDLRLSANQDCWPAQAAMEKQVIAAVEREGWKVKRAHPYDPVLKHGFIDSQRHGIEVFRSIPSRISATAGYTSARRANGGRGALSTCIAILISRAVTGGLTASGRSD